MKKARHLLNLLRFSLGGIKPITGPLKVQWDVIYACNSRCRGCDRWKNPAEGERMSPEREREIIGELGDEDVLNITFSGGEILLRKDISDLIRCAKSQGINVAINTNGLLLDDEVAAELVEAGIDGVNISLDGATADTHDYMRGIPSSFDHVIKAVNSIQKARGEKDKPRIITNTTIFNKNIHEIPQILKLGERIGVDGMTIQPAHCVEEMKFDLNPEFVLTEESIGLLEQHIGLIKREYRRYIPMMAEYFDRFKTFLKKPDELYRYRCLAGYGIVQIHPNGDVFTCPPAFKKVGNLKERSFRDIWHGEEMNNIRREIKKGKHPMCWFTCIAPLNIFISYIHPLRFYKLLDPGLIKHILYRVK